MDYIAAMNYLAHVYLSCGEEDLLIGNFLADFLTNADVKNLTTSVKKGVTLHRMIDSYSDAHTIFRKSTSHLRKRHGKYAGVLTDILYDYYLVHNWDRYSGESLSDFTKGVYDILLKNKSSLPDKVSVKVDRMVSDNFLMLYTTIDGLKYSLERMDKRTKFPSRFHEAVLDIEEVGDTLEKEFNLFFPEIIAYVDQHCECDLKV